MSTRPPRRTSLPDPARRETGVALLMAMFFTIVVTGVVVSGSLVLKSHRQNTETSFRLHGQASQFARAGLIEGLSWFRKQASQPVLALDPVLDMTAVPPIIDTADPDIGIVREFEISGSIWGRYEVWKEWESDPDLVRLAWRRQVQVEDISLQRGASGPGTVWRVRSVGYVFQREDADRRFDEHPNHVTASQVLEGEFLRMRLAPPGQAALSIARGDNAVVTAFGQVRGGATGAGVFYPSGTGTPVTGWVDGTPPLAPSASYNGDVRAVFGVEAIDLQAVADDTISDPASFPSPMPNNSVLYVEARNLEFTPARPLVGTGVIYAEGNVVVHPGSASRFNGLLYVQGDLVVTSPALISGAVVVNGRFLIGGSGDLATIQFDEGVLAALRQEIGQYRALGAVRATGPAR